MVRGERSEVGEPCTFLAAYTYLQAAAFFYGNHNEYTFVYVQIRRPLDAMAIR